MNRYISRAALLLVLIILLIGDVFGQITLSDSIYIHKLLADAHQKIEKDNDQAILLFLKADSLSSELDYPIGAALAAKGLGTLNDITGNSEEAINNYDKALEIYKKERIVGDPVADIILNKGVAYYFNGQIDLALEFYLDAYKRYSNTNNKKRISSILNNLGIIYRKQANYVKARQAYRESLQIKSELKDTVGRAKSLENIALLFGYENNIDSAIHYHEKAREVFETAGLAINAKLIDLSLGSSYYQVNEYEAAIKNIENGFKEEVLKNANVSVRIAAIVALVESYRELGKSESALSIAKDNLQFVEEKGSIEDQADIHHVLSRIYKSLDKNEDAYFHIEQYMRLYKKRIDGSKLELEEEMTAKFDLLEKDNKIKSQNLDMAIQQKVRTRLVSGVILVSVIALLLYFLLRNRTSHNRILNEKNDLIQESLTQRETLLKEIHHRVKNNLQIVSSLLNLQRRYQENEETSEAFMEGRNRVQSMALIHQLLYQNDVLTCVNAKTYIEKLAKSLFQAYKRNTDMIQFENDVEDINLDVDTLIPIGLIINELVTNALKYGIPEKGNGKIKIALSEIANQLILKVADSGQNFPEDDVNSTKKTFGYNLVNSLLRKLDGTLSIERNPNTIISLAINNYKLVS